MRNETDNRREEFFSRAIKSGKNIAAASDSSFAGKLRKIFHHGYRYAKYHVLMRLGVPRFFHVATFWGGKLVMSFEEATSLYYYGTLGVEEQRTIAYLIRHLKEDDIFFDVGAHYGFYAALAWELISNGEVHAFEPSPYTFQYLCGVFPKNIEGIFLNNIALSDKKRSAIFFDGSGYGESGSGTLLESVAEQNITRHRKVRVESTTLDEYASSQSCPTIIKLDAEGSEYNILQGGAQVLKESAPVIIMEVWRGSMGVEFSARAIQRLYALGYSSFGITEDGDLERVWNLNPSDDEDYRRWGANFVFQKDAD